MSADRTAVCTICDIMHGLVVSATCDMHSGLRCEHNVCHGSVCKVGGLSSHSAIKSGNRHIIE